jgi:hypothetical protein
VRGDAALTGTANARAKQIRNVCRIAISPVRANA